MSQSILGSQVLITVYSQSKTKHLIKDIFSIYCNFATQQKFSSL